MRQEMERSGASTVVDFILLLKTKKEEKFEPP